MSIQSTLPAHRFLVKTGVNHWRLSDPDAPEGWTTTSDWGAATRYTEEDARHIVCEHGNNPAALWGWDIEEVLSSPRLARLARLGKQSA